ncbi:hypothetical protein EV586_103393 [Tumebacillus sp. BK434]|uniref:hypothetical protein n=1 Tax=Tumebacillus sp. BK434 TaxID=2512169 RepID=UPI00104A6317|nr:hypothetical protein [Tumebacillus sp. BK434]TCP55739.1 hypothetical protein EV586_103393 [Tumebacillus sp. BK434]
MRKRGTGIRTRNVQLIYRSIDVITVVLLLSGQINISGVFFFKGGGFSLSFAGPITGGLRAQGVPEVPASNTGLDLISVAAALLLILDQINVTGTLLTQGGYTIVLSGPLFGESKRVAYVPQTRQFVNDLKRHALRSLQNS